MWQVSRYCKTGERNRKKGLRCQDSVSYFGSGRCQVISLADGAGGDDYASIGAARASEVFTRLLAENFDELYHMDDGMIQFHVITNIKTELYELCEKYNIQPERLQSTLLGTAIDLKEGRFLAVHLGDGAINLYKNGIIQTLSYPENGVNKSYTRLTSGRKDRNAVRIYRGTVEDVEGFLLVSDGWGKNIPFSGLKDFKNDETADRIQERAYDDDVSYIALLKN